MVKVKKVKFTPPIECNITKVYINFIKNIQIIW